MPELAIGNWKRIRRVRYPLCSSPPLNSNSRMDRQGKKRTMHTQFHIDWIGKQWIIDQLAVACGLRKDAGTYVDGDRIDRSKEQRRAVILSLVKAGFLTRDLCEKQYTVTPLALSKIEGTPWTSGTLVLSRDVEGYGLRKIQLGFLKTVLNELEADRVLVKTSPSGNVLLQLTEEAKTTEEQKAEKWVLDNLPALVHQLLDLSEASAQLVSLRGNTVGIPLENLPLTIAKLTDECCGEINRLRMREEALLMLTMRVERRDGGWGKFIAECRAIQKLHVMGSTPLREAVAGNQGQS